MFTQSVSPYKVPHNGKPHAKIGDTFGILVGRASLVATEFSYSKEEEIYGEGEPAEFVYQIVRGAVRTHKLLSDGRRQIGAFHLPGDAFGLEADSNRCRRLYRLQGR